MARTAAAGFWSLGRACGPEAQRAVSGPSSLKAGLILIALILSGPSQAEPVKGEASFSAGGGYARLVFKLAEDVESQVPTAGSILVVRFKRPVDIPIDKLSDAVPDYVGSVRRDPDGSAIRLSLARKVTINTMIAGERVFVDLLPDTWSGQPPGLPPEVVRELSDRALAAERALRQQRATAEATKRPPIRVRASVQPTFIRFVFEIPDGVGVSSVLNDQKLTLLFNAMLTFDLADAKLAAPSNIASIDQKIRGDSSAVEVALIGDVDVHSFHEERNYVIDVAFQQAEKSSALPSPARDASHAPASAAPLAAAAAAPAPAPTAPGASGKPADAPPASRQSGEWARAASESAAQQANGDSKPEPAPKPSPAPEVPTPARPSEEMPPPVAEASPKTPLAASEPPPAGKTGDSPATVSASRDSGGLRLMFSFAAATPAALFRRADTVWLVFDSLKPLDLEPIRSQAGSIITEVSLLPLEKGEAIRIRLNRPQLPSLVGDDQAGGSDWTVTFSDMMQTPTQPLGAIRNINDPALANVTVSLSRPGLLHRLVDPDAGDALMVVTAPPPVRGFIKRQDFVELSLLESIHGVAIRPNSDEVIAQAVPDQIILGKPGGLTLSSADIGPERAPSAIRPIFDVVEWQKNQGEHFAAPMDALVTASATAEPGQRTPARTDLARFYMSRGMYLEAKGVLDLAQAVSKPSLEDRVALIVHSAANSLMGRPDLALKDLGNAAIGTNYDSQLWKALAYARQGKWADAREKFKNVEFAVTSLPIELQRILIAEAMRCSLEVRDYAGAAKRSSDLDVVGPSSELKPAISVLRGRLAEALGHDKDALNQYKAAIGSTDRAAAAEAKRLEIVLRQKRDEISQAETLRELETLSVMWRGDAIEVRALQMMARNYAGTGRYGESFAAVRTATRLQPNSEQ